MTYCSELTQKRVSTVCLCMVAVAIMIPYYYAKDSRKYINHTQYIHMHVGNIHNMYTIK